MTSVNIMQSTIEWYRWPLGTCASQSVNKKVESSLNSPESKISRNSAPSFVVFFAWIECGWPNATESSVLQKQVVRHRSRTSGEIPDISCSLQAYTKTMFNGEEIRACEITHHVRDIGITVWRHGTDSHVSLVKHDVNNTQVTMYFGSEVTFNI